LLRNSPKKSSKIEKGWKDFCRFNRLKEGDILVFVADKNMTKKKSKSMSKKNSVFSIALFFHFTFDNMYGFSILFVRLNAS